MRQFERDCIRNLTAYQVEPVHYDIILNANENPWDFPDTLKKQLCDQIMGMSLNRYPDAGFSELLTELSSYTGVPEDQIICGTGSDELIAMITQSFLNPGEAVVTHLPSFAMYKIWTAIGNGAFYGVPDIHGHNPNTEALIATARQTDAKLIYLCTPNNPTGYLFPRYDLVQIIEETNALVIIDEAYMEFKGVTHMDLLSNYPNVIILRTLSKAFGLAGIRCGYAMASKELIDVLYKVKSPYNLNSITQAAAILALKNRDKLLARLKTLNVERRKVYKVLRDCRLEKLYPTASNFIYFETEKSQEIYEAMKNAGILIKYFPHDGTNEAAIRLSIGTPDENARVSKILKEVLV